MIDLDDPGHSDDFYVSTDKKLLDHRWLVATLLAQPWASCWTHERMHEAIMASLTFGLYYHPQQLAPGQADIMVGFGRVITDGACYSLLSDVVIDEAFRHRGLGKFLVATIVSHQSVIGTVCVLRTNSPAAAAVYKRFGFEQVSAMRRIPV